MLDRDLTRLSPGEELFAARIAAAKTQAEAARAAGLGRTRYAEGERGEKPALGRVGRLPRADFGVLCRIARRREGKGRDWVLRKLGITAPTLNAWERSGDPRLVAFWAGRGFTFARKRG